VHPHNHYYGQAHILARYCGLDDIHPPRIRGYLQPDWSPDPVKAPMLFDGAWRYLWSDTARLWSDAARRRGPGRRLLGPGGDPGSRREHVIGAPWLYLQELEPDPGGEREGTLWFFHGWGSGRIYGDHERVIAEIRETEPGPVTFALSHREYEHPRTRAFYADAGFDVLQLGTRGWNYEATDRCYLPKLLAAFRERRRVASNRVSTAVLYGIAAGCQPAVYAAQPELDGADPRYQTSARRWPELIGKDVEQATAREIADRELGTAWKLPPAELRMLLDWRERV
jgi:hypothetical protein